jgi:predicted RNA polymerase sigma factor
LTSDERVEDVLRGLARQVLGVLVHRFGDFARCEDAVQEALIAAADAWPRTGVPEHPLGWLSTVELPFPWRAWPEPARRRGHETTMVPIHRRFATTSILPAGSRNFPPPRRS